MDPQLKSVLTSGGQVGATAIATWAGTHGIVPADAGSESGLANALVTVGGFVVAALIAWYKTRQVSQPAMIQAVNKANNGVTVVPASEARAANIPPVDVPLK